MPEENLGNTHNKSSTKRLMKGGENPTDGRAPHLLT
jgi:hypothetical protein